MSADQTTEQTAVDVAARRTLERLGYTHTGGELWRPPLGPRPDFNLLNAKNTEIVRLHAANEILRSECARWRAAAIKAGHRGYLTDGE